MKRILSKNVLYWLCNMYSRFVFTR